MKASHIITKTFTDPTPAGLDAAIAAFVATLKEAQLIDMFYSVAGLADAPLYTAMLVYTK